MTTCCQGSKNYCLFLGQLDVQLNNQGSIAVEGEIDIREKLVFLTKYFIKYQSSVSAEDLYTSDS